MAIGGRNGLIDPISSCEFYDPATAKWTAAPAMNQGRSFVNAVLLRNGNVLVSDRTDNTCELFNPAANKWTYTTSMLYTHGLGATFTLLSDGTVLAFGGNNALLQAERYNPVTGVWTTCNNLNSHRQFSSAVLLNDGKIFIFGSAYASGIACEIFDPASGNFTTVSAAPTAHSDDEGILLDDGRVLMYGIGNLTDPANINAMQIYDPISDTWTIAPYILPGKDGYTIHKLFTGEVFIVAGNFTTGNGSSPECLLITPVQNSGCIKHNHSNDLFW
jgi:hypothetical protein